MNSCWGRRRVRFLGFARARGLPTNDQANLHTRWNWVTWGTKQSSRTSESWQTKMRAGVWRMTCGSSVACGPVPHVNQCQSGGDHGAYRV